MNAPHIILDRLPSFVPKIIRFGGKFDIVIIKIILLTFLRHDVVIV